MMRRTLLGVLLVAVLAAVAGGARAEVDSREMHGREAFAAGRYQEALDVFVKLYAEKLHPNYLRNIGRCYQNLGDPDKAISAFHEYLRKAKAVSPDERKEVEGYIKEMEDLKKQREATTTSPPPASGTSQAGTAGGAPVVPLPSSSGASDPAASGGSPPPSLTLTQPTPPPPVEESPPIYERWWFWTAIGGVIVASVAVAFAAGAFNKTKDAGCPDGVCQ